jgi:hypothetical protein
MDRADFVDRIAADRRGTGYPSGSWGIGHLSDPKGIDDLFDPKEPACLRPGRRVAIEMNPDSPRARHRFCAADQSNRGRLAPMGNRAISDDQIFRLSKLFQGVIDRRVGRVIARRRMVGALSFKVGPVLLSVGALC